MSPETTPIRLDLKKTEQLEIDWQDGQHCTYSLSLLRTMCPCAQCRMVRDGSDPHDISPGMKRKPLLTLLVKKYAGTVQIHVGCLSVGRS